MAEKMHVGGILYSDELVLFSVLAIPVKPGTAGTILTALGDEELNVEFIAQTTGLTGTDHILLCVKKNDAERTASILEGLKDVVGAKKIDRQDNLGLVFTFGPDIRYQPGVAGCVFRTLGKAGINIISISTSISTVSCVIDAQRLSDAVAALEDAFEIP